MAMFGHPISSAVHRDVQLTRQYDNSDKENQTTQNKDVKVKKGSKQKNGFLSIFSWSRFPQR